MRSLTAANLAALQARQLCARDFIWFIAKDRDTGDPVTDGYWSDVGTITIPVIDPDTGLSQDREFFGAGSLIEISDIPLVANLTVQAVTVRLSQISDRAMNLLRTYDCKQAKVQIFRGLFDPATRKIVSAAPARFVGYVDEAPITTPAEGEEGSVELTCVSNTQELTRANSDTRSHESQKRRHSGDTFYKDVGVVGDWEQFWGMASGKVHSHKRQRQTA
jgi:hypothetical protein